MHPDQRARFAKDLLGYCIMDAVGMLDVISPQYPPMLMLRCLIHSCTAGFISSRRIEWAAPMPRLRVCFAQTFTPNHDGICAFRRANDALLKSSFEPVLVMAAQIRVLRVGQVTLAIGGTQIQANASKHSKVGRGHAFE